MKRNFVLLLAMLFAVVIISGAANAGVPMLLSHQGRLLDNNEEPVTGTRDITFHIYEAETGGVPLWSEPHLDVQIDNGLFHVTLGGTVTISGDLLVTSGTFDPGKWLEIQVEGTTLSPRMRFGSVPYSVGTHRVSGDIETLPGALAVKSMGGSTTGTIRMQATPDSAVSSVGLDLDGDSVQDVATTMDAKVSRNVLKTFFQTGDFPTQAQFTTQSGSSSMDLECLEIDEEHTASVSADSTGAELKFKDGPILGGMSGSTTGTIRVGHGGGGGGGIGGDAFTVTGIFQDGTSEDVTEMKTARKDITINLRHSDLTGVDGDQTADVSVDSGGSELRLGSGPLSGMSGSTTGTIRVGVVDGGPIGFQQQYTAIGRFSDGNSHDATCEMTASSIESALNLVDDRDFIGLREYNAVVDSSSSSSLHIADFDGDGIRDLVAGRVASDSGLIDYLDTDSDDDGFVDRRYLIRSGVPGVTSEMTVDDDNDGVAEQLTKQYTDSDASSFSTSSRFAAGPRQSTSLDGSFSHARMICGTDLDDDGNNDVAVECKTTSVSGALTVSAGTLDVGGKYKLFSVTGQPTPVGEAMSSRMATGDNVDRLDDRMVIDSVTPSQASRLTAADLTGDGVPDVAILDRATSSGAVTRLSGRSGSTTGTIRMAASPDSSKFECGNDANNNGNNNNWLFGEATITGARSVVATDSDDNGVPDVEAELACDVDGARSILSGMSGSTTGTIRMVATADSVDREMTFDDPLTGASMKVKEKGARTKCSSNLRFMNPTDSSDVLMECDSASARHALSGMSGSTTGTIRMAASPDSAVFDLGLSGSTTGTIRIQVSSSGAANPIEHSSGAHLTVGGDWTNASDENLKENFTKVDGEEILEKISELDINQWNYKSEDESITHIGPTAQDFQKTFGVGSNDKSISTIDPSGIALAAIKQLIRENEELRERIKALEEKNKK